MQSDRATGFLVVFEGIDGTGKSTQAALLETHMQSLGRCVVRSREPTNGPYGQQIRESALRGRRSPAQELELFVRDRREHVEQVLQPALDQDKFVIVDRYYLSTAAYQGARGLDPEAILRENEAFAPIPDVAVLLELPVREGRQRIRHRGDGDGDLFELEDDLQRVADVFAKLDRPYIKRFDSARPIDLSHQAICDHIEAHPRFRRLLATTAAPGTSSGS